MKTINIQGNLTADAKGGVGQNGKNWASFSVAVNEYAGKNEDGSNKEIVEFFNVSVFGAQAEAAAKLTKGAKVAIINGKPSLETFERKDGSAGSALKVTADARSGAVVAAVLPYASTKQNGGSADEAL